MADQMWWLFLVICSGGMIVLGVASLAIDICCGPQSRVPSLPVPRRKASQSRSQLGDVMQIGRVDGCTRVLGKSQGYIGLPIRDEVITCTVSGEGTPAMITAWFPTPDEIARINAGAPVHLRVLGSAHPPVMLDVGSIPTEGGRDVLTVVDVTDAVTGGLKSLGLVGQLDVRLNGSRMISYIGEPAPNDVSISVTIENTDQPDR